MDTTIRASTEQRLADTDSPTDNRERKGSVLRAVNTKEGVIHADDDFVKQSSAIDPGFGALSADSKDATEFETTMTFRESLRYYGPAAMWSLLLSTAVFMEGYDHVLIITLFGLPSFNERYHNQVDADGTPTISAPWKSGLTNAVQVGEIIGLSLTGIMLDRFGYKKTIAGSLLVLVGLIFITFFATSLNMLLAGEFLCGLPWGVFQVATTSYASEVAPVALRAYLSSYVNMCWSIGQLIEAGVMRAMADRMDQWGYRIPFALQWMWPIPLITIALLMPESPWWLVRKGKHAEAEKSLDRLTSKSMQLNTQKTIAMMEHTTRLEGAVEKESTYLDLLHGVDRRRTEIVCMTWITQAFCGANLMGYSTVFYERAGMATDSAFSMSMGVYAIGVCAGFSSWFWMNRFGRRTLYVTGQSITFIILLVVGFLGIGRSKPSVLWSSGSLILLFALVYDSTVGPVCYSLVSELPSTRLKAKSICVARMCQNIASIVVNVLTNYQLTTTAWNWGPFTAFFWAGTNLLCLIWMIFRLPEPKHRTYGELDILFEHRVSAWKFKSTKVDAFRGQTVAPVDDSSSTGEKSPVSLEKTVSSST